MKNLILVAAVTFIQLSGHCQIFEKKLSDFNKIVVSPFIDVELQKGATEGIKIVYSNVEADKINVQIKGKTLRVYLDDAKFGFKRTYFKGKYDKLYAGVKVKAIITYNDLRNIQIAGRSSLTCEKGLKGDRIKIKAYDEAEVTLASITSKKIRVSCYGATKVEIGMVEADKMRIAAYGDNDVKIGAGQVLSQTFRAYGDNIIDARGVRSSYIKVGFLGDNELKIDADDEVKLTILGEGKIQIGGTPHIRKGVIIGSPIITSL